MSIANLKKLATAFNVPHAESTTAGHECLHCVCEAARQELKALVDAAVALTDMLEDGMPMVMPRGSHTGNIQREAMVLMTRIRAEATMGFTAKESA